VPTTIVVNLTSTTDEKRRSFTIPRYTYNLYKTPFCPVVFKVRIIVLCILCFTVCAVYSSLFPTGLPTFILACRSFHSFPQTLRHQSSLRSVCLHTHLALAVLALQPLKFRTLSLHRSRTLLYRSLSSSLSTSYVDVSCQIGVSN